MQLALDDIKTDSTIHIRQQLYEETIVDYMDVLDNLPPIVVFDTPEGMLLADGFHRYSAAARLSRDRIDTEVRKGTRNDALEYAISANVRHGKPLTVQERREGIRRLRMIHPNWTNKQIAKVLSCSEESVSITLRADKVRRTIARKTTLSEGHLEAIARTDESLWPELSEIAEEQNWSRDETRAASIQIRDENIPSEHKREIIEGKRQPLTVKGNQVAILPETMKRLVAEEKKKSTQIILYSALEQLARLRRHEPKKVIDDLSSEDAQRLIKELPGYIVYQQELVRIARQRLELWEVLNDG